MKCTLLDSSKNSVHDGINFFLRVDLVLYKS
ncbi:hypothetical protein T09_12465 [Trichinella sp. T9]|nr:hypothetical protein T09_12465 [Trichinella sp. T9]